MKVAVIGHPLRGSLSPIIHGHWLKEHGIAGNYEAIDIPPAELTSRIGALVAKGYTGFSVTMPHKQAVMSLCADIDDTAHVIGAVNTIAVSKNGTLAGHNTDWHGFIASIRDAEPALDFAKGHVLVLGAGGAARAIVYGLKNAGAASITIANRTRATADALAREFGAASVDWGNVQKAAANATLLVNATSLGMNGQGPLEFDVASLPRNAVVCDIVYKPLETKLLAAARARGLIAIDGLGMLIQQARRQFQLWTGIEPAVTPALRAAIERALPP